MKKIVVGTVAMLSLAGVSGQVSATEPTAIKTSTVGTESSVQAQAETQIAAVTSLSTPQEGQKNRSSGNFSVENLPAGTYALKFVVEGTNSGTHFNVMKDVSGGTDPTIWSNVLVATLPMYKPIVHSILQIHQEQTPTLLLKYMLYIKKQKA
ncbi:hypothetical protein [Priestia endophytica]|uniref:hypothetical protein n=1 Tax=Priestia endophytica TaxID=135735 RepID=UPI0027E0A083|nr:hypothetical protein [Priestia endophytica]